MNSALLTAISGSAIRWAMGTLGAFLVARGFLSADDVSAISPQIQEALGGLVSAAALGWGAYQKQQAAHVTAAKELAAAQTGSTTASRAGDPTPPAVTATAKAIVADAAATKAGA